MKARRPDPVRMLRTLRAPDPPPADAFWPAFRGRARPRAEPFGAVPPAPYLLRWAAAAAVLLAAVGIGFYVLAPPSAAAGTGVVRSLSVTGPYDSVLVVEDADQRGTIVWIRSEATAGAEDE